MLTITLTITGLPGAKCAVVAKVSNSAEASARERFTGKMLIDSLQQQMKALDVTSKIAATKSADEVIEVLRKFVEEEEATNGN